MSYDNDTPRGRNRPASDRAPMCPICNTRHFSREPHSFKKGGDKPKGKKR